MPTPAFIPPPAHDAPLPPPLETSRGTRLLVRACRHRPAWDPPAGDRRVAAAALRRSSTGRAVPARRWLAGGQPPSRGPRVQRRTALTVRAGGARHGIAVASADYRLSGEATWPAQLHDVKAAVRWLRARAGELGIDGDRIAAWGESAGGHLAELLGLTTGDPALEGDVGVTGPSSEVCAVVAWYAPSDLRMMAADTGTDPMDPDTREARLLGAPPPIVPTRRRAGQPHHARLPAEPRRSCCCTARPTTSSRACRAERLHSALRKTGLNAELVVYPAAAPHVVGLTRGRAAGTAADDRRPHVMDAARQLTASRSG